MQWSEIHANFLVNLGKGSFEDAKYLIDLAKEKIFKECGVTLQEEIKNINTLLDGIKHKIKDKT